jgi:glycosyltransferase involved in cell wall biosynthesis
LFEWWDGNLPSGTAGAEESVVEIARLLAAREWKVTVFNNCGVGAKTIRGVDYHPVSFYNPNRPVDITIVWRSLAVFDDDINANLTYLWLHDYVSATDLSKERLTRITKIFSHRTFHRDLLLEIPESKIILTNNGIDVARAARELPRHPGKCIYTSAPDRGLECLLLLWPRIRREVPNAELHLYYGWDIWDVCNRNNPTMKIWKESLMSLMQQEGIKTQYEHVDPDQLWDQYLTSSLWLYPTEWNESSCISAMKAQACGAIPVTTNVAALKETVQWGAKIDCVDIYSNQRARDDFIAECVRFLTVPNETYRRQMRDWALKTFSWEAIADQWDSEFRASLLAP